MKTFKGLSLVPLDALKSISAIIECGHLMTSCSVAIMADISLEQAPEKHAVSKVCYECSKATRTR